MFRKFFAIALFAPLVATGCGDQMTGPGESLCRAAGGVEVCVDRSEYSPSDFVSVSVRNTGSAVIFKDACSTKLVGKTTNAASFEERFDPTFRCGPGATTVDVIANMVELSPGESFEETLQIVSFAFQGFYRVNVWIVGADGELVSQIPAISPTFDVFPSAG